MITKKCVWLIATAPLLAAPGFAAEADNAIGEPRNIFATVKKRF